MKRLFILFLTNYCSSDEINIIRWAWHVACKGVRKVVYGVLVGKSERKLPLARPMPRWEDINSIFRKWDVRAWTGLS
jgi:hypothetical protein